MCVRLQNGTWGDSAPTDLLWVDWIKAAFFDVEFEAAYRVVVPIAIYRF